jgi:site-specific DNA recombinase
MTLSNGQALVGAHIPTLVPLRETAEEFVAAQGVSAARGPSPRADPAGPQRLRYLLSGLLACGVCGRRMESAWSNGRPAGAATAIPASRNPIRAGRRRRYVREDRILAHLPALHLLLSGEPTAERRRRRTRRGTGTRFQASAGDVIQYLRERQITLTYDPATSTLHAGTAGTATTVTLKAS